MDMKDQLSDDALRISEHRLIEHLNQWANILAATVVSCDMKPSTY
jgi:hypothetical protein